MHKDLKDFWHFSRRYRQFQLVSSLTQGLLDQDHEVSEETRKELDRLNGDRIAWHNKIAQLDLPSLADCGTCNGACCNEPSEHYFTAIDYWLRKYTPHQVHGYALHRARPLHEYYRIRIKSVWPLVTPAKGKKDAPPPASGAGCAHLGETGCRLPHVERPLKCLMYACPGLKRSLNENTRQAYAEAVRELQRILFCTFNVLKLEAGLPSYYGVASVLLTL